jgi:hypothetical protein
MSTLFELTEESVTIDSLLEQLGGEIPNEETERAIDAVLADLEVRTEQKMDAYAGLIEEYAAVARARREHAKKLEESARRIENKADVLKGRLLHFFERTGRTRPVVGSPYTVAVATNGGKLPLKLHCQPEQLPEEYRREVTTYKADQDAIRAALEAGTPLVFAELGERGKSLRIK